MSDSRRATQTGGRVATAGHIPGDVALAVGCPREETLAGFRWRLLADLARLESGHTPSRRVPEYWDGGTLPWIGIRDATGNHGRMIDVTNEYITELGEQNSSTRLLPSNTVCLSRTASVGYVVVMGVPMCTSQDFVNWVCGPDLDFRYLKYVLLAEKEAFLRFASGTTHQTIYFPEVKAFHVLVPGVPKQRAIADVLGALDDKIESNRRIVQTAVDLARRVLETGSTRVRVRDVAEVQKGLSYKGDGLAKAGYGLPMVNLGNFKVSGWLDPGRLKHYSGEHKVRHEVVTGDLLVSNTDLTQQRVILGRPALVPPSVGRGLFTHHVFVVRTSSDAVRLGLWAQLNGSEFRERAEGFATGTTVAGMPADALLDFEFNLPGDDAVSEGDELIRRAWSAEAESVTLAALRDALLPELLSGRMRVQDAKLSAERPV